MPESFPILDDHFHINRRTGVGPAVVREFMRSGGTHIVLVSLPSWSHEIFPTQAADFRPVFDELLETAKAVRAEGCICYPICGVHPAEIGKLCARMSLGEAEGLLRSAGYAFSPAIPEDVCFAEFIENGMYDLFKVNARLYDLGLKVIA